SKMPAPAWQVRSLARKSSTLLYVTRGLLGFSGFAQFPPEWNEGSTLETRLRFFGVLPAWKHEIAFERVGDSDCVVLTREGGGLVPVWNHLIQVQAVDDHHCVYTDDVEIKAGLLTPFVWLYSHVFYRYR